MKYPFSAVLGCDITDVESGLEPMGLALVLTAISPQIGGVLVRGEKGTAKSTTVRALADVLPVIKVHPEDRFSIDPDDADAESPDGPFDSLEATTRPVRLVELPVGADEERVVGSLDLAAALGAGSVTFEPGLLARAHRGVLYVDEVNLLGDHLVDLLLDAAASGQVTVERDALSLSHAARFVMVGTMNPEEGELRPQLLDRFGLTVEVAAPRDPALRVEVVRRRLAHDANPSGFAAAWAPQQQELRERIQHARSQLSEVVLSEAAMFKVAQVCAAFEVDGLRADIVTTRTALAHAAWCGRDRVTRADIRAAALLALPHRRRRNPFDTPGLDEDLLDQILGDDELPPEPEPDPDTDPTEPTPEPPESPGRHPDGAVDGPDRMTSEEEPAEPAPTPPGGHPDGAGTGPDRMTSRAAAGEPYRPKLLQVDGLGSGSAGRRSKARGRSGARVGSASGSGASGSLHVVATVRAAAERRALSASRSERLRVAPEDLHRSVKVGREANLLLFCVDASGSVAARKRMAAVKTAILSLLGDAYRRRDKVAMISFRGRAATLDLPPTGSIDVAAARLDELPSGGRTPLAEALLEATAVLRRERLRDPSLRPLLVLLTDGRATAGPDAVGRSRLAADHLARLGVASVVVDCESGPLRLGLARILAQHLGAEYLGVEHLDPVHLTDTLRGRVA